jgi:hypothetical protein
VAEVIDKMPTMDGRSVYDWAAMSDGKVRKLERGKDFNCQPRSLRLACINWARRRKVPVDVRVIKDTVYIQLGETAA